MVDGPKDDALDLDRAASKEFSKVRKGVDPSEVQAHVLSLVEEIRRLRRVESDLAQNVRRLETDLDETEHPDASAMTKLLGEETARVLDAAREASEEIRSKSEENASRLVREAHDRASRLTEEATKIHETAARDSDELLASARASSDEMLRETRERTQKMLADAEEKAADTLDRADRVLAEKTDAAEAAAELLRREAEEIRDDARRVSEELTERAEKQAEEMREKAAADAAEHTTRAEVEADRILEEAITESGETRRAAEEDALARVETAREQGRTMVSEAREARERMLRDLAERRKLARQQLEALRAGRERMLESFAAARSSFDTATSELVDAVPNARTAADGAARAVDEDIDAALAELDLEIGGRLDLDDDIDGRDGDESTVVQPSEGSAGAATDPAGADEADDVGGETSTTTVREDGSAEGGPDRDSGHSAGPEVESASEGDEGSSAHLRLVAVNEDGGVGIDAPADEVEDLDMDLDLDLDEEDDDEDDLDEDGGDVEMLFARLRAERADPDVGADHGGRAPEVGDENEPFTGRDAVVIDLNAGDGVRSDTDDATEQEAGLDESSVALRTDDAQQVLDRRDELIDPVAREVNRRLKRWVSDLENGLMDRVRRQKKDRSSAALLEERAALVATCAEVLEADLARGVSAGAEFLGVLGAPSADPDAAAEVEVVTAVLSDQLVDPLVNRLEHVIDTTDDASPDGAELVGRIRAVHREWRGDRLTEVADDLVHLAFNRGVLAATPADAPLTWVVDFGGLPCPDAEDNNLAGAVNGGAEYPTGHVCPPAHPGCRCVLVPQSDS